MYKEENKNIARESVLKAAIETLTLRRKNATLAPKDYVRKVKEFYKKKGNDSRASIVDTLSEETIIRWEEFYDSVIQDRTARSIKVAYLSGPNPENDLTEMTKLGLLPENIWAFESDAKIYNEAVISALSSKFPFIKIIKANIGDFFEVSPQKFDIIYLDFCGPLPSKKAGQKTLKAITSILKHHALSPLGVMITNVSLPSKEQNENEHKNIVNLVASYLYPKSMLESNDPKWNCTDGAISESYSLDKWHEKVECEIEDFYGQYITRLLVDLISVISPYDNFTASHSLYKNMFKISDNSDLTKNVNNLFHFDHNDNGGDIIVDSSLFPILWTIASIDKKTNHKDVNYYQEIYCDDEFNDYAQSFLSQLSANGNAHDLIKNISNMHFLLNEGRTEYNFYSDSLKELNKINWLELVYPFCDLFLFHQIKEVLFRQLSVPYHVNIEKTARWKYKAKETNMYMDMLVLDECRYLYDWMPSLDMFYSGMMDLERQFSFRFILDAVAKHRMIYNNEFFYGTASVSRSETDYIEKILTIRKNII